MKRQFLFLAILLGYWTFAGLALVAIVKVWPWLSGSPWLFAAFAPFFIAGMALRVAMRKKLAAERATRS